MGNGCLICDRLAMWRQGRNPYVIAELEHSLFVVGDHQFHRGYSLLLLKEHVRELHELPDATALGLCAELLRASRALVAAFAPWKMNQACYGNAEPHVHWHLMPRHADDPDRHRNPWRHSAQFKDHMVTPEQAREIAALVRRHL
jgi:diadenosine tetraphosphate (Ap4A) HIT family hydrolase